MKGLLLKDIYMLTKYCRSFLFMMILFMVVGAASSDNLFFIIYPSIFAAMLPVTLLSYDERSKWNRYSCTLPCTGAQIVSSKYILGTVIHLATVIITLLVQLAGMSIRKDFSAETLLLIACTIVALPSFSSAIALPIMFRFGTEKGRIVYFFVIGACTAASIISSFVYEDKLAGRVSLSPVFPILLVAAVVLYAVSWKISITFYKRKEF